VRTHGVVVSPPGFDHDLGLIEGVEDLSIEQLVTQLTVEALAITILPGASRLDVGGLGTDGGDSFQECLGNELRTIV
jgi:hypothetical protein